MEDNDENMTENQPENVINDQTEDQTRDQTEYQSEYTTIHQSTEQMKNQTMDQTEDQTEDKTRDQTENQSEYTTIDQSTEQMKNQTMDQTDIQIVYQRENQNVYKTTNNSTENMKNQLMDETMKNQAQYQENQTEYQENQTEYQMEKQTEYQMENQTMDQTDYQMEHQSEYQTTDQISTDNGDDQTATVSSLSFTPPHYPVTTGRSFSTVETSFHVLGLLGDRSNINSSLELELSMGTVRTFDEVIQRVRGRPRQYPQSFELTDTVMAQIASLGTTDAMGHIPGVLQGNIKCLTRLQLKAANYLHKKRIFDLFNFMICHLLSAKPDHPIEFMMSLLNQCLLFRNKFQGKVPPPLAFSIDHLRTIYKAFDIHNKGHITAVQYRQAMRTLGISTFRRQLTSDSEVIPEVVFIMDARRCLTENLNAIIQVTDPS